MVVDAAIASIKQHILETENKHLKYTKSKASDHQNSDQKLYLSELSLVIIY